METESEKDVNDTPQNNTGIHFYSKHKYRDTFGDAHIQYHDFDNVDAFIYRDKYAALLQQELQNPYWCLHDPVTTKSYQISTDMDIVTTKSYQISTDMDIETMPHAMNFLVTPTQSPKSVMSHIKQYSTMIKVCFQHN